MLDRKLPNVKNPITSILLLGVAATSAAIEWSGILADWLLSFAFERLQVRVERRLNQAHRA